MHFLQHLWVTSLNDQQCLTTGGFEKSTYGLQGKSVMI